MKDQEQDPLIKEGQPRDTWLNVSTESQYEGGYHIDGPMEGEYVEKE